MLAGLALLLFGVAQVAQAQTVPTVSSVFFPSGDLPASGDTYTLGEHVHVQVDFDVPVTVTGTPRIALTVGSATRQAEYYFGSGTLYYFRYVVQSSDLDTDGIGIAANALSLNGGTIVLAADGATAADLTHDAVADDPDRKVDGSRVHTPTVRSVIFFSWSLPASGDTYTLGEDITRGEDIHVRVGFDVPVTVTGTPQIALTVGSATRQAEYSSGSSILYYFRYRVQSSDLDTDGIGIAANALSLNGGTIVLAADGATAADLTHDAVADDSDRKVDGGGILVPPPLLSLPQCRTWSSRTPTSSASTLRQPPGVRAALWLTRCPGVRPGSRSPPPRGSSAVSPPRPARLT